MSLEVAWIMFLRAAIILSSGEIFIRYSAWWIVLRRRNERLAVAPILVGISIVAACTFGYELQIMIIKAYDPPRTPELLQGWYFAQACRALMIVGACCLSWPVSKLQYNHTAEQAMAEMCVRLYLIGTSLIIGWCACWSYMLATHGPL